MKWVQQQWKLSKYNCRESEVVTSFIIIIYKYKKIIKNKIKESKLSTSLHIKENNKLKESDVCKMVGGLRKQFMWLLTT